MNRQCSDGRYKNPGSCNKHKCKFCGHRFWKEGCYVNATGTLHFCNDQHCQRYIDKLSHDVIDEGEWGNTWREK